MVRAPARSRSDRCHGVSHGRALDFGRGHSRRSDRDDDPRPAARTRVHQRHGRDRRVRRPCERGRRPSSDSGSGSRPAIRYSAGSYRSRSMSPRPQEPTPGMTRPVCGRSRRRSIRRAFRRRGLSVPRRSGDRSGGISSEGRLRHGRRPSSITAYLTVRFRPARGRRGRCNRARPDGHGGGTEPAGYDLDLNVVAALLTVAGYSVNDTIVIFDRVRERLGSMGRGQSARP